MTTRRLQRVLFRALPAVVLLSAFVGICIQTGTPWPWNRVVHEDGVRTLLQTVFFFEHATRELLPDLLLALAVAGAVRHFFPPVPSAAVTAQHRRKRLGWLAAATLAVIVGGTIWVGGWHAVLDNLSQSHTRAGAPLVWGAHWRYHLIERLAQMLLAFAVVGAIWMLEGRPASPGSRPRWLFGAALIAFAVLTLVFDPSTEPFQDPAFLGHQLRELFTHTLVTLPLALGVCLGLATGPASGAVSRSTRPLWPIGLAAASSVLCGVFLLAASLATGAQSHGQATGLGALLFPHFAEHALGYMLVPAVAGFLYLFTAKKGT